MASSARIDELKKKFDENPRRYFAPLANEYRKVGRSRSGAVHLPGVSAAAARAHERAHRLRARRCSRWRGTTMPRPPSRRPWRWIPRISSRCATSATSPARPATSNTAREWYQRVLEADPRNEEIVEVMASLASRRRRRHRSRRHHRRLAATAPRRDANAGVSAPPPVRVAHSGGIGPSFSARRSRISPRTMSSSTSTR